MKRRQWGGGAGTDASRSKETIWEGGGGEDQTEEEGAGRTGRRTKVWWRLEALPWRSDKGDLESWLSLSPQLPCYKTFFSLLLAQGPL